MPDQIEKRKAKSENEKWLFWWAIVFAAASVLITGYRVYFHNQALQIPLVRLLNDPSLYPNDPFAATLPYYASSLWRVVAWGARVVPLEPLLLGLFLIERFVVIYAAGNLALAFAPKSRLAMAGAMAFFATDPTPIIGGGTLLMPYFEQTSLAVGFLMLAMAAFYRRRPLAWAVWLAAGFNCNSMYGCYALTYFGAVFLLDSAYRREWRQWIRSLGIFVVLAIPAIALSATALGNGTVSSGLWFEACRARVPHHIFPSTWPWIKFARFTVLMLVMADAVALGLRSARNRRPEHPEPVEGRYGATALLSATLIWTAVSVGWVVFAIAAERLHSPTMLMLQPARATDLWYAFAVTALMAACAMSLEEPMMLVLALIPFALFDPLSHMALIPLAGVALVLVKRRIGRDKLAMAVAIVVLAAGVRAFVTRAETTGIAAALAKTPGRSIRLVCDWARTRTTKDAMFLVNPNWGEFRGLSARPAFVTWKDGSALLWNRPFAGPWAERMQALGYDVSTGELPGQRVNARLDKLYGSLADSDARRLAERYGVRYWVVPTKHESGLPVTYSNLYFKVLRIR